MHQVPRRYLFALAIFGSAMLYILITLTGFRLNDNGPYSVRSRRFTDTLSERDGSIRHTVDSGKSSPLIIELAMTAPGWIAQNEFPTLAITSFGFDKFSSDLGEVDRMCLDRFYMNPIGDYEEPKDSTILPYCEPLQGSEVGYGMISLPITATVPMTYSYTSEPFWYPYDSVDAPVSIRAQFRLFKGGRLSTRETTFRQILLSRVARSIKTGSRRCMFENCGIRSLSGSIRAIS
jgi:hypothetical protein